MPTTIATTTTVVVESPAPGAKRRGLMQTVGRDLSAANGVVGSISAWIAVAGPIVWVGKRLRRQRPARAPT